VLEKRADNRLPSVARAAASPSAIVLAGAGVAVGEAAHWGLAVAVALGAVGYGGRLAWAAGRRHLALRRRGRRRLARVDPWSVPEPWRGYAARALEARKTYRQLSKDCPSGPVADYLIGQIPKVDAAVQEQWALVRSGSSLVGAPGRPQKVAEELNEAQKALARVSGADRGPLEVRQSALASQLRSLRQMELVGSQVSSHLAALVAQLEGVVASAGELVASAEVSGPDMATLSAELSALVRALDEAKRMLPSASATSGPGL
jgi:hypothetical protein